MDLRSPYFEGGCSFWSEENLTESPASDAKCYGVIVTPRTQRGEPETLTNGHTLMGRSPVGIQGLAAYTEHNYT